MSQTYFNRKSRGKLQGHEVSQSCKMGTGSGHEVNNGSHLLHQGKGVFLTHPQRTFESVRKTCTEPNFMYETYTAAMRVKVVSYCIIALIMVVFLLLCSNAQFYGSANVSVPKVKVGIEVFLWCDGGGIGGSCIFKGKILEGQSSRGRQLWCETECRFICNR